jgi:catechol 2,3-dioxygenase-like lactoylglutathione lyase family enzyme
MATNFPINPRVRAFGKARIDFAVRARNQTQWEKLWVHPVNTFPFFWGESWKQCIEYKVDDFPAEVGFFIDVLGLPINALDPGYAMFTSPKADFFFAVVPTPPTEASTPPDAFRLQFMVKDIVSTTDELQRRGINFEQIPQQLHPGSSLSTASFRTPHGICVELWGKVETSISPELDLSLPEARDNGDEMEVDAGDEFDEDEDETSQDSDDDDLGEASESEEDEDDEDDDLNGDEDFNSSTSNSQKNYISTSPALLAEVKLKSPDQITADQNKQSPEYIDLDLT